MKVIADISITPMGVGVSISEYVAACENVFSQKGLNCKLHAHGTNVEGSFESVMEAVKGCHEKVHSMGAPRISTTIRLLTRTDREQTMDDELKSVENRMKRTG